VNNVNTSIGPSSVGEKEHVLHGVGFITEHLRGLVFEISANSFFQTNTDQVFTERGQVFIILWECGVSSIPIYIVIHNFLNTSQLGKRGFGFEDISFCRLWSVGTYGFIFLLETAKLLL
jgi:hypothetical protein